MLPTLYPIKIAPEVIAFLVEPDTFAAARERSRTYGAPNDCLVSSATKRDETSPM